MSGQMLHKDDSPPPLTDYFTGLAALYTDHRPGYPPKAVDWILENLPSPILAADLGCGTGISARLLAQRGAQVIGIEPNLDMLAEARRLTAPEQRIEYRHGAAERTGLSDAAVDLVACAQSFHWFEPAAALREFHRILRRDGRLALLWNVKHEGDPFSAMYANLMRQAQADATSRGLTIRTERQADATAGGFFANSRQKHFRNAQRLGRDGLLGRARSASYFPRSGPVRSAFESQLMDLFGKHERDRHVNLIYRTEVTLVDRT